MSNHNNQLLCDISSDDIRKALFHLKKISHEDEKVKSKTKNNTVKSKLHQISFNQLSHSSLEKRQTLDNRQNTLTFKIYNQIYYENRNQQKNEKPKKIDRPIVKQQPLINMKSKEIIMKKEKLGKYIPIHLRTQNEIRKKNEHLNKIKDEMKIKTEITLKQCTFKPNIMKSPNDHQRKPAEVISQLYKWQQKTKQKLIQKQLKKNNQEGQTVRNKQNFSLSPQYFNDKHQSTIKQKRDLQIMNKTSNNIRNQQQTPDKLISNRKIYKNKNFNVLLDLIH